MITTTTTTIPARKSIDIYLAQYIFRSKLFILKLSIVLRDVTLLQGRDGVGCYQH